MPAVLGFSLGVLFVGLGGLIWKARPRDPINIGFGLFTVAIAMWAISISGLQTGTMLEVWGRLAFASAALISPAFLTFTRSYPTKSRWPSTRLLVTIWTIGISLAVATMVTPFVIHDVRWSLTSLHRTSGPLHPIFAIYFLVTAAMGLCVFLRKWRTASGVQRVHCQYLGVGLVVAATGAVTSNLLVPWIFEKSTYSVIGPYFLLPLVIMVGHAVLRHKLFDLRLAVGRLLVFSAIVALPAVLVAVTTQWLAGESPSYRVPIWAIVSVVVAAVFISKPAATVVERLVDAYLFRGRPDLERALNQAVRRLARALTEKEIFEELEYVIVETIAPEWLVVQGQRSEAPRIGGRAGAARITTERAAAAAAAAWKLVDAAPRVQHVNPQPRGSLDFRAAERELGGLEAEVWMSIGRPGSVAAVVVLGSRSDGRAYFTSVLDFLQGLADVASVVLETVQLHHRKVESERDRERSDQVARMGRAYAELAHEIRTPLTTISNLIAALPDRLDDEEYRSLLISVVPAEIARITGLAEQLRSFSSDAEVKCEMVELGSVLHDVVRLARASTEFSRRVQIDFDGVDRALTVVGDRNRLVQLFLNLLVNAIEASTDDGRIFVRGNRNDSEVIIQVVDNGAGVPREIERTLCDPFVTTKSAGRGLGLAICVEIVRAHGGRLSVANRSDGQSGTMAEVALPYGGSVPRRE